MSDQKFTEQQQKHLAGVSVKTKESEYEETRGTSFTPSKTSDQSKRVVVHKTAGHDFVITLTKPQCDCYHAIKINQPVNYDRLRAFFRASTVKVLLKKKLIKVNEETLDVEINNNPYDIQSKPKKIAIMMPFGDPTKDSGKSDNFK